MGDDDNYYEGTHDLALHLGPISLYVDWPWQWGYRWRWLLVSLHLRKPQKPGYDDEIWSSETAETIAVTQHAYRAFSALLDDKWERDMGEVGDVIHIPHLSNERPKE